MAAIVSPSQDEQQNVTSQSPSPDSSRLILTTYISSLQHVQMLRGTKDCPTTPASGFMHTLSLVRWVLRVGPFHKTNLQATTLNTRRSSLFVKPPGRHLAGCVHPNRQQSLPRPGQWSRMDIRAQSYHLRSPCAAHLRRKAKCIPASWRTFFDCCG